MLDQLVDLGDGLLESAHHVFWSDLKFVDESIDFVDEKNRLNLCSFLLIFFSPKDMEESLPIL